MQSFARSTQQVFTKLLPVILSTESTAMSMSRPWKMPRWQRPMYLEKGWSVDSRGGCHRHLLVVATTAECALRRDAACHCRGCKLNLLGTSTLMRHLTLPCPDLQVLLRTRPSGPLGLSRLQTPATPKQQLQHTARTESRQQPRTPKPGGASSPPKYGGRDADPDKPIVMGKLLGFQKPEAAMKVCRIWACFRVTVAEVC